MPTSGRIVEQSRCFARMRMNVCGLLVNGCEMTMLVISGLTISNDLLSCFFGSLSLLSAFLFSFAFTSTRIKKLNDAGLNVTSDL